MAGRGVCIPGDAAGAALVIPEAERVGDGEEQVSGRPPAASSPAARSPAGTPPAEGRARAGAGARADDARPGGPAELRWRLDATVDRAAIPALCARLGGALATAPDATTVVCDVSAVEEPTLVTVEALARLLLTARRLGHGFRLAGARPNLLVIFQLAGLTEILPGRPAGALASGLEEGREAEQREQAVGVQEVVDPGDLPV
ncbi:STAS domain-containing protein [Frankia sp. CNm7]|nr:STAS domain-containing protein [Frankia nepalensis]